MVRGLGDPFALREIDHPSLNFILDQSGNANRVKILYLSSVMLLPSQKSLYVFPQRLELV